MTMKETWQATMAAVEARRTEVARDRLARTLDVSIETVNGLNLSRQEANSSRRRYKWTRRGYTAGAVGAYAFATGGTILANALWIYPALQPRIGGGWAFGVAALTTAFAVAATLPTGFRIRNARMQNLRREIVGAAPTQVLPAYGDRTAVRRANTSGTDSGFVPDSP